VFRIAAQNNYYVDILGSDDLLHGTTSGSGSWKTIRYAIQNIPNLETEEIILNISSDVHTVDNTKITIPKCHNFSIIGGGVDNTYIQPSVSKETSTSQVFEISGYQSYVTVKNLTIRYGIGSNGGGVRITGSNYEGIVNFDNVKITECTGGSGAGIYMSSMIGNVNMSYCTISNNICSASGTGAGIYSGGAQLTVRNSSIINNSQSSPSSGAHGGGGGVYGYGYFENCTISGNYAESKGGGIACNSATIVNCTIAQNTSNNRGGGIHASSSTTIKNSILAMNTSLRSGYHDYSGTINSQDYNLIGVVYVDPIHGTTTNNILGENPLLNSLSFNGGATKTHSLQVNSPAIDQISQSNSNGSPAYDQRGVARVGDYEIGAFESTEFSLPVEISSFSAYCRGKKIFITWETQSETNNLGFILERKNRKTNEWHIISSYKNNLSLRGRGNTSSEKKYQCIDVDVKKNETYVYRLSDVDLKGDINIIDRIEIIFTLYEGSSTELMNPFPNPFNPLTKIDFILSCDMNINIYVYDTLGRKVSTLFQGPQEAGNHNVYWNGRDKNNIIVTSGTYFIVLLAEDTKITKKVLLIR